MKHIKLFEEFIEEKKKGLWANVWAKRKRGEKPAKPGDKDYPDEKAWKAAQEAAAFYIDSTEVPIRLGNKIELANGQHGVVLSIVGNHEAMILLANGVMARINPQTDVKQLISDTEPTKGNKPFMD